MLTSISKIGNFFTDECKYPDFSKMGLNFITYQEIVIKKYVSVFSLKVTLKSKGFKKALVESCQDPAGISLRNLNFCVHSARLLRKPGKIPPRPF